MIHNLSKGLSAKEIASQLGISHDAITNHKDNIKIKIKEKFDVEIKNVVEMVVWSIKNKLIDI